MIIVELRRGYIFFTHKNLILNLMKKRYTGQVYVDDKTLYIHVHDTIVIKLFDWYRRKNSSAYTRKIIILTPKKKNDYPSPPLLKLNGCYLSYSFTVIFLVIPHDHRVLKQVLVLLIINYYYWIDTVMYPQWTDRKKLCRLPSCWCFKVDTCMTFY